MRGGRPFSLTTVPRGRGVGPTLGVAVRFKLAFGLEDLFRIAPGIILPTGSGAQLIWIIHELRDYPEIQLDVPESASITKPHRAEEVVHSGKVTHRKSCISRS